MAQEEIFLVVPWQKVREPGAELETGRSRRHHPKGSWCYHPALVPLGSPADATDLKTTSKIIIIII